MNPIQPHGPIAAHGPLESQREAVREGYASRLKEARGMVSGQVPTPVPPANERPEDKVPADKMDSGGNRPRIRSAGG